MKKLLSTLCDFAENFGHETGNIQQNLVYYSTNESGSDSHVYGFNCLYCGKDICVEAIFNDDEDEIDFIPFSINECTFHIVEDVFDMFCDD